MLAALVHKEEILGRKNIWYANVTTVHIEHTMQYPHYSNNTW